MSQQTILFCDSCREEIIDTTNTLCFIDVVGLQHFIRFKKSNKHYKKTDYTSIDFCSKCSIHFIKLLHKDIILPPLERPSK